MLVSRGRKLFARDVTQPWVSGRDLLPERQGTSFGRVLRRIVRLPPKVEEPPHPNEALATFGTETIDRIHRNRSSS